MNENDDTANPAYNETARDRKFFPLQTSSISYRYLKFESRDCKHFQLETGFRYSQVPFQTGFTVFKPYI